MKLNLFRNTAGAMLLGGAVLLSGCAQEVPNSEDRSDSVKIGIVMSLTGPAASFGVPEHDAALFRIDQINEAGGVNGMNLEGIVVDDKTDPTEAARAVRQLITQDDVVGILGATTGSASLAAAPIAASMKTPIIAPNGTISVIDENSEFFDWTFRGSPSDLTGADASFDVAVQSGAKTMAIFYQEDAFGDATTLRLEELAVEAGIEIVEKSSAELSALEVTNQVLRIKAANPDIVFLQASSATVGGAFMRGADQVGLDVPVITAGALGTQPFIDAASGTAEGARTFGLVNWSSPTDRQALFAAAYAGAGHGDPKGFGEVLGSTGIDVFAAALERVDGEVSGEKLRDALNTLCPVEADLGTACFSEADHDGWTLDSYVPIIVRDGTWVADDQ